MIIVDLKMLSGFADTETLGSVSFILITYVYGVTCDLFHVALASFICEPF